ncbi:hypothetical protein NOS3756_09310 [Nostoc sp. NIES-3756]|nr:hypothetical protein NOS3756_09310 [Nostoc sp. NIES-3756]BAY40296.1 hypothetical protein NIES2111_46790 [Nostoc sp. NIES-2111]
MGEGKSLQEVGNGLWAFSLIFSNRSVHIHVPLVIPFTLLNVYESNYLF